MTYLKIQIVDIYKASTKFGQKCLIKISHKIMGAEHSYTTYLPDRYASMTDLQISLLKNSPNIAFRNLGKNSDGAHVVNFTKK